MRWPFLGLTVLCVVMTAWTDPIGDTYIGGVPAPALDLTELNLAISADEIHITLGFDPATTDSADLQEMWGFIDLDTDQNPETGRFSHLEEFGWEPYPPIGADFFVYFTIHPIDLDLSAFVFRIDENVENEVADYPVTIGSSTVTVTIPRCYAGGPPTSPTCMGVPMDVAAVFASNLDGLTDRFPNDEVPKVASFIGDFDVNGAVDADDLAHLENCRSGPRVPQTLAACEDADLDKDGDVDQGDFGILQRSTGAQ